MSKLGKKLLAAGLCLGLVFGTLTGCGSNAGKAIATLDGEKVDFALVNFLVRYNQAQMQSAYGAMFGQDMWKSYGESAKQGMVESVEEMLILEKHMDEYQVTVSEEEKTKITEAAKSFMESNDKKVLEAMTASQEVVEQMLTLNLIQTKMRAAIIKDVDTEVSDEEAAQKTIKYVMFSTADTTDADGKTTALTDEEKAAKKEQAQTVLDAVKGGTDIDAAAKAVDDTKSASTTSYGKENGSIDDKVKEAVDSLKDGECADGVIETDNGYYVAQMESTFDKEATESQKATIVTQRQNDKFTEVYEAWKEKVEFTTDTDLLAKITFTDTFEVKITEAATEAVTEAVSETTAETGTEAASEKATETGTEATSEKATETGTKAADETKAASETETAAATEAASETAAK